MMAMEKTKPAAVMAYERWVWRRPSGPGAAPVSEDAAFVAGYLARAEDGAAEVGAVDRVTSLERRLAEAETSISRLNRIIVRQAPIGTPFQPMPWPEQHKPFQPSPFPVPPPGWKPGPEIWCGKPMGGIDATQAQFRNATEWTEIYCGAHVDASDLRIRPPISSWGEPAKAKG